MKRISLIAMCCVVIMVFSACGKDNPENLTLELGDFKNENSEFCYKGLDWNSSAKDTQKVLGFNLGEAMKETLDQGEAPPIERQLYNPTGSVKLLDKTANSSSFEFRDDKLTSILFSFKEEGNKLKSFGDSLLKKLSELYSDDYEVNERKAENGGSVTKTYDWQLPIKDGTSSHLQLMTLEKTDSYIVYIGVLRSNPNIKADK